MLSDGVAGVGAVDEVNTVAVAEIVDRVAGADFSGAPGAVGG